MAPSSSIIFQKELFEAKLKAHVDGIESIVLTNIDPEADYNALIHKNAKILERNGLFIDHVIDMLENKTIKVTIKVCHKMTEQYEKAEMTLNCDKYGRPLETNSPDVFFISRVLYEGLFGIVSSNDAIEAELFGPKRKHREISKPYDCTADFIEFEFYDHTGKKCIKKQDRRKFERSFLGMTSEQEAQTKFEIPEYRRFSWSDIKLFLRCQRCFYNTKKLGIKLNDFDNENYALQKATEILLKKELDQYRERCEKHPIMEKSNAIRPLKHKNLDKWRIAWTPADRFNIGGIQFHDVWGNWMVYGGVDDIWLNNKKELIIVDYKSSTNGKIYPEYKQQIEFYTWIFRKRNYPVSSSGYLLFYQPIKTCDAFNWQLKFEPNLIEVDIDDSWVQKAIVNALECLSGDTVPLTGISAIDRRKKCNLCDYFDLLTAKTHALNKVVGEK